MRDSVSVLLNSWDNFLVALPSISSETSALYSSVIPRADVFRDWLFLGYSCASLDTAANFRLFLNVAVFGNIFNSGEDLINSIFKTVLEYNENVFSPFYEQIVSNHL